MAPLGQGLIWSEVLCCPLCSHIFSGFRVPVNLSCGHAACLSCLHNKPSICPSDSIRIPDDICDYPINTAILLILNVPLSAFRDKSLAQKNLKSPDYNYICEIESSLHSLARYLRVADSERGGSVYSDLVSRTIQRKIITILCSAITQTDGRIQAMRSIRSLSERIVTELICVVQNTVHLSAFLWSAVRSRGCQFLGPAMQEDVLKLILLTLANGELIARKTLVMYIVQTLSEDYPHVSKTCVGHVVQLLYRASCFNVIKRDGESSLMQLKEEFREYEALRREHDSQIVQIALEAGLRISPDQWSALLYGDPHHRSHMQSIVDRLHSPQLLSHALKELRNVVDRNSNAYALQNTLDNLATIAEMDSDVDPGWKVLAEAFGIIETVISEYVSFNKKWNNSSSDFRFPKKQDGYIPRTNNSKPIANERNGHANNSNSFTTFGRYKTKMCRDVLNGRPCPRGSTCTYAHVYEDLRPPQENEIKNDYHDNNEISANGGGGQPLHDQNGQPRIISNELSNMQQGEMIPMPIIPLQQMHPKNPNLVMENTNGAFINMVPVVMHPQMGDMSNDQFTQPPPTPLQPQPVGLTGPIYMVPQPDPPPVVIPNHHQVQVIRGPPPLPNYTGMYSYHIAPPQPMMQPPPSHLIYPSQNMWAPPPTNQLFRPSDGFYATGLRNPPKTPEHKDYDKSSESKSSSEKMSTKQNWAVGDEGVLIAKRNEVLSRLMQMDISKDECGDDDAESHVSFTVANSVLFDDVEMFGNSSMIDFPPLPLQSFPNVPTSVSPAIITDAFCHSNNIWTYPITFEPRVSGGVYSVKTVCPTTLLRTDSTKPAMVQSDCSVMNVKDAIDQPLVTSSIQRNNLSPQASYDMVDPCQLTEQLPRVMKANALTPEDPQDFVSSSIDKIITVRGKINEEMGSSQSSAVEQEQLKVELNIANRQLSTLDQQTKQSCLLKELKAIDEKIENLGSASADST